MAKKNFAVLGLGKFGSTVALTLSRLGHHVLAVDLAEENVAAVADHVTQAMVANATDERVLRQLDPSAFDCIVVAVGTNLTNAVLITVQCKELGAPFVIAKAADDLQARVLLKTGADQIVNPEYETGVRLAHSLLNEPVLGTIPLSPEHSITERPVPFSWAGHTLAELNVRKRYGVNIIAVKRDLHADLTFGPDYLLQEGDILVLAGATKNLTQIEDH